MFKSLIPINENSFRDRSIESAFEMFFDGFDSLPMAQVRCNAYQTDTNITVELYAPNLSKDNINITISDNILKIEGNKLKDDTQEKKQYYRREFTNSSFIRTIVLPAEIQEDKVEAKYENGMLKITIPKKEALKPKNIKVK